MKLREKFTVHNREVLCGSCSKLIYLDQERMSVPLRHKGKEYFHADTSDCMERIAYIVPSRR